MTPLAFVGIALAAAVASVGAVLYHRSHGADGSTRNPVVITAVVIAAVALIVVGVALQQG
jgi:preprotein translocase subunit SecG